MTDANTIHLTVDLVAFCGTEVLVIERGDDPYAGHLALPGGYVDAEETSRAAAAREAAEETGLAIDPGHLHQLGVYDDPDRDPRGRVVSVAYTLTLAERANVIAGDDAAQAYWLDIEEALKRPMAFDHRDILIAAYSRLVDGITDQL
ncbi:NUDIX hydrolase [Glycomyces sp. NPDC049804]|uniref:NUDIX hydrolase n=1 Tax=Glycomyces sp. NPDC049804 TaxID=3154363 RepID=UPI0034493621